MEPQSIARLIVSRLEPEQQEEVIRLVQHPREIPDPGHGTNPHWERYKARTTPPEVLAQQRAQAKAEKRAQRAAYEAAYRVVRQERRKGGGAADSPCAGIRGAPGASLWGLRRGALPLSSPASG